MCFALLCSYQLTSGYKPAPMDLSFIKLTPSQEAMVDKLAENAHNVWARDRIRQGWTYGIQQVPGDQRCLFSELREVPEWPLVTYGFSLKKGQQPYVVS